MTGFWAVLWTKALSESLASTRAREAGFECYLPMTADKHGRTVPLFPRYSFVRIVSRWIPLLSIRGVVSVIRDGDAPAHVPDREIDRIRERHDASGLVVCPTAKFIPGQAVRIIAGLLRGDDVSAYFEHPSSRKGMACITANGLRVELPERDLASA